MTNRKYIINILLLIVLKNGAVWAADWPQYRCDASRSGYTKESLPMKLSLAWMRIAHHKPHRAWVGRSWALSRMKFDWAYEVVIADHRCFFGSSSDHNLYALDARTGEEKWHFFTGGPCC